MAGKRYEYTNHVDWRYLGPAFLGIDADLTALESGAGGLSPNSLVGVTQRGDGSWELSKAEVDAMRPCKVAWFEVAAADQPVTASDGVLDGDIVNSAPVEPGVFPETPTPNVTYVTVTAPTKTDADGTAGDRVVLTKSAGVTWFVADTPHNEASFGGDATKEVPTGGALAVAVRAEPASSEYAINPGHTVEWSLTFTDYSPPAPATALMEDDFGTSALTEQAFLARVTPTGARSVTKSGPGAVTVNAAGQLVIDGTAGATNVDWDEPTATGKLIMDVVSITGLTNLNSIDMQLRTGIAGKSVFGRISLSAYRAQVRDNYSSAVGNSVSRNDASLPKTYTHTLSEDAGTLTATIQEAGSSVSTHSLASSDAGSQRARLAIPAGVVLTIGRIRKETP